MGKNAFSASIEPFTSKMAVKKPTSISTYGALDNLYKVMRVQGYNFPERYRFLYGIYATIIIGYATFYMPFAFTVAIFKTSNFSSDLSAFFTTLQVTFDMYGGTGKILLLGFMLQRLRDARPIMDKLDARCIEPDEVAEQVKLVRQGRKIVVLTIMFYFAYSVSTCVGAIFVGRPPYAIYFPFIDWRNSNWEKGLVTVLEFIMMNLACVQQTVNDSYATVFLCILRSHLRILMLRIKKLGSNPDLNSQKNVQELIKCIKDHKVLLELQEHIRPVISGTIFIQFSLTAIVLGTALINVMIFSTEFSVRLGSCIFFAAVSCQSFPHCYFAQRLLDESSQMSDEIFHSQWIEQNLEYRRIMIYFMHRSQSLMKFNAAKLFPITLSSFLKIAKFSFTLYTFIKKMDLQ